MSDQLAIGEGVDGDYGFSPTFLDELPPTKWVQWEPVYLDIVGECTFKAHPCQLCGKAKTNADHKAGGPCKFKRKNGCRECGKPKSDDAHMGLPPSLNVLGSGNPQIYMGLKDRWKALLTKHLEASELPRGCAKIMVEGELTFPAEPRAGAGRDQGNFRVILEKALGDALVDGGWLEDDRWEMYEFGNLAYSVEPGVSATHLLLLPG